MGQAYTYRCDRCGYEARFNEGNGYHIHRQPLGVYLNSRRVLFHYKTHNVLRRLARSDSSLTIDAGFKIYKCPHCNLLYDKVEVKVMKDGTSLHKSEFRCLRCRTRLKLTNIHRLKQAVCPSCRNSSFRINRQQMVLWG